VNDRGLEFHMIAAILHY